jgi:hypothetical protein
MQTHRETVRKKYEEQNSVVKPEEARSLKSEVKSVISVVKLRKPLECYHCSELRIVIVTGRLQML